MIKIRPDEYMKTQVRQIPGAPRMPLFQETIPYIIDSESFIHAKYRKYGPIFRSHLFGTKSINFVEPEAIAMILRDEEQIFSNNHGWAPYLAEFFSGGLMLRDFEDHRVHRIAMQKLFRPRKLQAYLELINQVVEQEVAQWPTTRSFKAYQAIKELTLKVAARVFLGIELDTEAKLLNKCFTDMVRAALVLIRKDIPGTQFHKGIKGKKILYAYLKKQIPLRKQGDGQDMFTYLCQLAGEEDSKLSDDEVLDHINFLLMAAHDTITSSLTTSVYYIACEGGWQNQLRDMTRSLAGKKVSFSELSHMRIYDWILYESLRLYPPVFSMPRVNQKEFTYDGYFIPKGSHLSLLSYLTHRLPQWWTDPERFDPLRFAPDREEHKQHKYIYLPFGGGTHRCLGMAFAGLVNKSFLHALIHRYRISLSRHSTLNQILLPIPRPRHGLPIQLESLN